MNKVNMDNKTTIRGLDKTLHMESVIAAKRAGITWGEWLNNLIRKELEKTSK